MLAVLDGGFCYCVCVLKYLKKTTSKSATVAQKKLPKL